MIPILSVATMEAVDRSAIEAGSPVRVLMERAGAAVARSTLKLAGGGYGNTAVLLVGKGHNGGDALAAGRRLREAGMGVTALLLADPERFDDANRFHLRAFLRSGGRALRWPAGRERIEHADVLVDGLFGIGLVRAPKGEYLKAIVEANMAGCPVVAVDIPSGVMGDTGAMPSEAIAADVTVSFTAAKPGHYLYPGAGLRGDLEVVDIGIPLPAMVGLGATEASDVAALLPALDPEGHKRARGVVLVVAGSRGMTGAAALVARGALRAGAGLVTVATPVSAQAVVAGIVPEATSIGLAETPRGTLAMEALERLLPLIERFDVLAVGPGLGTDPETREAVKSLVGLSSKPLVLDADGCNALAGSADMLAMRLAPTVVTPHPGEFSRMAGVDKAVLVAGKARLALEAAAAWRSVVVLKGAHTVVANPDGRAVFNPTGGPELATGGSGDVLTGGLAALMARGLDPFDAARAAVFLHGLAGDLSGIETGEGTLAGEIAEAWPRAAATLYGLRLREKRR
ncbi:MAG: NAD(P)H-hydrate dehydratase [Actinomycetota bacterium]